MSGGCIGLKGLALVRKIKLKLTWEAVLEPGKMSFALLEQLDYGWNS